LHRAVSQQLRQRLRRAALSQQDLAHTSGYMQAQAQTVFQGLQRERRDGAFGQFVCCAARIAAGRVIGCGTSKMEPEPGVA
jgi:hypothetical protein